MLIDTRFLKRKEFYITIFILLTVILLFYRTFNITSNALDPDFGWHLKTGELTLERGIPKQDWYSYTMPNFPWVNHEWLTDIIIYKTYSIFGSQALLLIFLTLYFLSFYILKRPNHLLIDIILPFFLGIISTTGALGIRPQILTVFFTAILVKLIWKFLERSSKLICFLPFLFFIWANLHGGFFIGLFILLILILFEIAKKATIFKKIMRYRFLNGIALDEQPWNKIGTLFFISILSFLATLINPYFLNIYVEVFRTIFDNFIRSHIAEWIPLIFVGSLSKFLYVEAFIVFLVIVRRKIKINDIFLSLLFLCLALLSVRHFLLFVVVSFPVFCNIVQHIRNMIDMAWFKKSVLNAKAICITAIFVVLIFSYILFLQYVNKKNRHFLAYPERAISFINTIPLSENMFNEYDWGGYLIWKVPERKVFIDGRMPSWRQPGRFTFGDYIKIKNTEEGFEEILLSYDVKFAFLRNVKYSTLEEDITNSNFRSLIKRHPKIAESFGLKDPEVKNLPAKLQKIGWKVIYQDEVSIVLKR